MLIMGSTGLKVPKRAVQVELHLYEVGPRRFELYLAEQGARDPRPESVVARLEDDAQFLPGRDVSEEEWALVNKAAIVWADVPEEAAVLSLEEELYDHRRPLEVELIGGGVLRGELLYSAPDNRARTVDYLNQPGRFLRVFRGGGLALVNKGWILRAVERPGA